MVWRICLTASFLSVILSMLLPVALRRFMRRSKRNFNHFNFMFAGVFVAAILAFFPVDQVAVGRTSVEAPQTLLLSVFHAMQIFTIGTDYSLVSECMPYCPDALDGLYLVWTAVLYVLAPIFTFGFILSLFKNISANLKYLRYYFRDVYVFSELNDRSLVLAEDLKAKNPRSVIVFTDVFEDNEETIYELTEKAKALGAVCFKKDILVVNFNLHSGKRDLFFFTIGENDTENLNQALKLIEQYKARKNTHLYISSVKVESELLLTAVDKGEIKVRRINEVQSLINRVLYESGELLFQNACPAADGIKDISAVVVGMGRHGTEMVKALAWYCQMDGYRVEINAYDKDPLAREKFTALAPELMSGDYNGVQVPGEAQYHISIHPDLDVETASFADTIRSLKQATYVLVALGNDDVNIKTAVTLRMLFERMGIHPVIHAIVYNSQQKKALQGIRNYRGQAYDIDFIGDLESCYREEVILDSDLEAEALRRHLKWGKEEEFWSYEYNYRSSMAAAIHMRARIRCGIPGADKAEEDLTGEERHSIEVLEHRRWNAYMRAEGYIYSGSKDKSSRNDLAKMHHDLVDFSSLSEEDKRKDSKVGTQ